LSRFSPLPFASQLHYFTKLFCFCQDVSEVFLFFFKASQPHIEPAAIKPAPSQALSSGNFDIIP
ncbi:MAG: hypothetical protein ACLSEX_09780, partial [Blautia sp.]